jgi:hypothetical protein
MKVEERRFHKKKKKFSVILIKFSIMILPKNRRIRYFKGLGALSSYRIYLKNKLECFTRSLSKK